MPDAMARSVARAWSALEIALAGETWWTRLTGVVVRAEDQALARRLREFLDQFAGHTRGLADAVRQQCLAELRAARKAGLLGAAATATDLVARLQPLTLLKDPQEWLKQERHGLDQISRHLTRAGHGQLGQLLSRQDERGSSVLVVAVRYYFRRE